MEAKNHLKEAIQKALISILEKKRTDDMIEEEDEVLIEPFMLIDKDDCDVDNYITEIADELELHEFVNLSDVLEQGEIEIDQDAIDELKTVANEITPVDGAYFECDVLGESRLLIDKLNCRMKDVAILGVTLLTPVNLSVELVKFDSNMKDEGEIELTVILETDEHRIVYSFTVEQLIKYGLLITVPMNMSLLELSPFEFRGIIKQVDIEELQRILFLE